MVVFLDALLERLLSVDGPSGFERPVRAVLEEGLRGFADRVYVDGLGNVFGEKLGGEGRGRVLVVAHMDEVGFMVQHITREGFIRFTPLGGWDERVLPGLEVKLLGREEVFGVVSTRPPHITSEAERKKVLELDELYIDTGLGPGELAEAGVEVGTPIVPVGAPRLRGRILSSKALDDRLGCYNLLRLARSVEAGRDTPTYVFVGTVQEEVGLRGAQVVANSQRADVALILEATVAGDTPGVPEEKCPSKMGGGAVLTVMDRSMIADHRVYSALRSIAEEAGIRYQVKKPGFGGTDAGAIHVGGSGTPSGVVSVPCRYIHTARSLADLSDVEEVFRLAAAFLERHPPF